MNSPTIRQVNILLVDDSPTDVLLTQEAFADSRIKNKLDICHDGEEAIKYLRNFDNKAENSKPDMILLDLNMPRKDGREVLAEIKSDIELKKIPIIVLTTSKAEEDIVKSYQLAANCYITKPVDFNRFSEVIRSIENFWLMTAVLPPN